MSLNTFDPVFCGKQSDIPENLQYRTPYQRKHLERYIVKTHSQIKQTLALKNKYIPSGRGLVVHSNQPQFNYLPVPSRGYFLTFA